MLYFPEVLQFPLPNVGDQPTPSKVIQIYCEKLFYVSLNKDLSKH